MNNNYMVNCGCDVGIEQMVNEGGIGAELSYPAKRNQSPSHKGSGSQVAKQEKKEV